MSNESLAVNNENHPEQAREALDAWACRPGITQEQATILITEAFWALKERPNMMFNASRLMMARLINGRWALTG
ncbi:hypothetical protein ECZC10_54600 [Escherichia coli]|nr:hypothetical protein ECZC10_54600 [Escherichia coli]